MVALLIGLHSGYGREKAALAALFTGAALSFLGYGVPAWAVSLFDEAAAEGIIQSVAGY